MSTIITVIVVGALATKDSNLPGRIILKNGGRQL